MRRFRPVLTGIAPDGWFARESIHLSDGGGGSVVAAVEFIAPGTTLERYAQEYGEILSRELPGFAELDLSETTLASGAPGLMRRFRWTPEAGEPVTQLQLYALEGGKGVVATATAPADSFAELEPMLHELLRGIELPRAWVGGSVGLWEETPRHATYQALLRGELVAGREPRDTAAGKNGDDGWADARRVWAETRKDRVGD